MNCTKREIWILGTFLVLITAAFGGLFWRVYDLKYNQREKYTEQSRRQLSAFDIEKPRRGQILDGRGRKLADSMEIYNAFVEPRALKRYPDQVLTTAGALQEMLNIPGHEICGFIYDSQNEGYVKIKADISKAEKDLLRERRLGGVGTETTWKRVYPAGHLGGHILGFVGVDNTGLAGLEMKYNETLAGTPGKEVFVVDVAREPIATRPDERTDVEDGHNLMLTIDAVIQRFVYEALKEQVDEYEAESGVAVVMDPWTGAVLAMVSLPDYDPANFSAATQDVMRNRVLTDPYEPGSIFKPIVTAIALDAGTIGFNEKFDCEQGYWAKYGGIGEFGSHRYGMLSVREIIIHSSNIGMAKIGLKTGKQKLYDGLKLFGFSQRTGIDLPGEDPGLVWSLQKWSGWSVTRIPFGHEVLVTPLQICRAYCIMANGGYLVTPHIVHAVVDNDGRIVERKQPPVRTGYILKSEVAEWMVRKALTDVVNEGTGDTVKLENCQAWGKTGTANIAVNGRYDQRNYVASFVGGAPAEKPAVVVLVSIRKPNRSLGKGYSGGRVAGPVVHDILENTLRYLGVTEETE